MCMFGMFCCESFIMQGITIIKGEVSSLGKVKTALSMGLAPIPEAETWSMGSWKAMLQARGEALYLGEETGCGYYALLFCEGKTVSAHCSS